MLITNDASISRNHAVIDITNDTMKVTDQGSKYGIYINDQKVTQGVLKEGDLLRLGQFDSVYAVQKLQVSICLSGVSDKQKVIDSANAKSIPTVEVVDCTYLVMNELKVTKKVLIAMGRAIHILSPKFVTDITVTNFPDPQNYMPRMAPNLDPQLALPNKRRLTLFKDKTVVFFSQANVDSFGAVIEAVGGKFVFKANTKVCKCGGCEDILCMSTYCACSNVDCLNLHIYFVQESKTRDRYYNAIYKEFPSMFITTEAISLCILECDFSKICPRKIVKEPKILNPTPNAELDLNYRHDWANTVEEPTNSQFPSEIVAEEDEQATINESFAPITDQVEDLFFQTAHSSATKMHDNLPAGSRMEATAGTFNESNLNTQPKVCSNLDDLLDEMMDFGYPQVTETKILQE